MSIIDRHEGEVKECFTSYRSFARSALEKGILGVLLYPADEDTARVILSTLRADFFSSPHRIYFQVLKDLYERGVWPVDDFLLIDEAVRISEGKLEHPLTELASLREASDEIVTPEIWPEYVDRFLKLVERDKLKAALEGAVDPTHELEIERLQEELNEIMALRVKASERLPVEEVVLSPKPPPPVPELIEGLLPEGHIAILGGKRGSFKSWLACHLAIALATGGEVFEFFRARQMRVLLVDEENGPEEIKRRLWKLAPGLQLPPGSLNLLSLSGFSFADDKKRAMLERYLSEARPGVVIFDTLASVMGGIDENDAAVVRDFVTRHILPMTRRYRSLFLFIHHLRKAQPFSNRDELDQYRGSSEWVNIPDIVITIKSSRDPSKLEVSVDKSRRGQRVEPFMVAVEEDEETGKLHFRYAGSAIESEAALEACKSALIEWMTTHHSTSPIKRAEIDLEMQRRGYARTTVGRVLTLLSRKGILARPSRGYYQLSRPTGGGGTAECPNFYS